MEGTKIDFAAIPQTARKVLTSPAEFFKEMPKSGGFVEPLVFLIAMGVAAGFLQSILSVLRLQVGAGMAMGLGSVIILPILIGIFGFVGAAILFLVWRLTGSQESYETAYRCGAYIGVLTPLSVLFHLIPYVGVVVSILLMTCFLVTASVAVHGIPSRKAWAVFGIIGGLLAFFSVSAEIAARRVGREAAEYQKKADEAVKTMQKQTEQLQKQAEEAQKALEQMQKGAPKER